MPDVFLGGFEYNANKEVGMHWLPNKPKIYDLFFEQTIIGDFLVARYGEGTQDRHFVRADTNSPFPPLVEAKKRAKAKGLI